MKQVIAVAAAAAALVAAAPLAPAAADAGDLGNATGGGWSSDHGPAATAQERAESAKKQAEAHAYNAQVKRAIAEGHAQKPSGTVTPNMCSINTPCGPVTDRMLNVAHAGQVKDYYCGPAAGLMILRYEDEGHSAYNGASLVQGHVGGPAHMKTDVYGKTSWYNSYRPFKTGLNRWRGDGYYIRTVSPSNSDFRDELRYDIDRAMPFGASTVEMAGQAHYNHHPKFETIGHWITAQGYKNNLDNVSFDDPAGNASGLSSYWDDVQPNFSHTTNGFNSTWISPHGIVW